MYVVCVTFQIQPGAMDSFLPLMRRNARASLDAEPGCHHFDVCTSGDRPDELFLYELYTDRAAFDAHLHSPHFLEFDAKVAPMIASKTIRTYLTHPVAE